MNLTIKKDYPFPQPNISFLAKDLGLTRREWDVLEWVARGKTNKEVGVILGISRKTVSKNLEKIYTKLGVTGRIEAIVYLFQLCQERLQVRDAEFAGNGRC